MTAHDDRIDDSVEQQAKPKPSGQMELLRAQFTALSRVVKMMPSSSRRFPKSSGLVSVTCLPSDVLMVFFLPIFAQASGQDKWSHNCAAASFPMLVHLAYILPAIVADIQDVNV